ncbi:MAG: SDR family NAD(P)-dependent oxidoreductase [Dehalococcoidia bacterium]
MRRSTILAAGIGVALAGRKLLARPLADLTGEVAIVTGGSRGLGLLLARELSRQGCRTVICARDEAELERARTELRQEGIEVVALRCDVADQAQVTRMTEEVTRQFGRIDILVNVAGIIQVGPLDEMTVEDFRRAHDVMYWGSVYPTLAVLPAMRDRWHGRIVNITSIGGKVSVPHLMPYSAAKFAAVGFSEGLRAELAGTGITVTTIAPGLMRTGSHLNAAFKGRQEQEFTWFGLGASLPFISIDAERAARQIVGAMRRGEADRTLTVPATLLATFHGVLPGVTADIFGLVNRFVLPSSGGAGTRADRGMTIEDRSPSAARDALTEWGQNAAERFNEHPGPVGVTAPMP